jgi:hypothetical protein
MKILVLLSIFTPLEIVVVLLFSLTFLIFSFIFQLHFSKAANIFIRRKGLARTFFKGRRHFHQAQRFGANIFQRPQTFSSGAKIWRKHFFKGCKHFHQAQRFGANIFQRPQTFSSGAKVWPEHFFKDRKHFSPDAKVWRKHLRSPPVLHFKANNFKKCLKASSFPSLIRFSSVKYARSKAKF